MSKLSNYKIRHFCPVCGIKTYYLVKDIIWKDLFEEFDIEDHPIRKFCKKCNSYYSLVLLVNMKITEIKI